MKVKPFYISTCGLSGKDVAEAIDKCVRSGAHVHEGVNPVHTDSDFYYGLITVEAWKFFGVDDERRTTFEDEGDMYGDEAMEITLDELDEWLGIESSRAQDEKLQEWNGEGLPPVGAECEVCNCGSNWQSAKVLFMGTGLCVVDHGYGDQHYHLNSVKFRKQETPEQREERERMEVIKIMCDEIGKLPFGDALEAMSTLYDLGYRKAK